MAPYPYDDGLDVEGYPISSVRGLSYVRGSEDDAGDAQMNPVGRSLAPVVQRARHFSEITGSCDSPIEDQMGAALLMVFARNSQNLVLQKNAGDDSAALILVPQFAWSFYRSDWAVYSPQTGAAVLVECDGKDFHSSEEQRAHDARKDAAAALRGYRTIRFAGSQIHADADGCADRVFEIVSRGTVGQ